MFTSRRYEYNACLLSYLLTMFYVSCAAEGAIRNAHVSSQELSFISTVVFLVLVAVRWGARSRSARFLSCDLFARQ